MIIVVSSDRYSSRSKYSGRQNIYSASPNIENSYGSGLGLQPSYSFGSQRYNNGSRNNINNSSSDNTFKSRPMSSYPNEPKKNLDSRNNRPFSSG